MDNHTHTETESREEAQSLSIWNVTIECKDGAEETVGELRKGKNKSAIKTTATENRIMIDKYVEPACSTNKKWERRLLLLCLEFVSRKKKKNNKKKKQHNGKKSKTGLKGGSDNGWESRSGFSECRSLSLPAAEKKKREKYGKHNVHSFTFFFFCLSLSSMPGCCCYNFLIAVESVHWD